MAFVHANGQTGTLPTPMGIADVSVNLGRNWTGASGTAKLVFDPSLPGAPNPAMEIVYATVATGSPNATALQRGQENTAAQTHSGGATWLCGMTGLDLDVLAPLSSPTFTGTVTVPTPVNPTDAAQLGSVASTQGVFNVKTYGATGNGTTDDTAAIQAAINAAAAAGGGVVFFPPGTYSCKTPGLFVNNSFITLRGSGRDVTTLTQHSGVTLLHIQGTQAAPGDAIVYVKRCVVEDLTIDLLSQNSAHAIGHYWYDGLIIRRVRLANCNGGRFAATQPQNNLIENFNLHYEDVLFDTHVSGSHIESVQITSSKNNKFRNCEWKNIQYACLSLYQENQDTVLDKCYMHDGVVPANNGSGCHGIIFDVSDRGLTVIDSVFERLWNGDALSDGSSSGGSDNFGFTGSRNFTWLRNTVRQCNGMQISADGYTIAYSLFEFCQSHAILVGSSTVPRRGRIVGNTIRNNGQGGSGGAAQAGIALTTPCGFTLDGQTVITGNTIYDDQVVATQTQGININVSANRPLRGYTIEANDLTQCATPLSVSGTLGPDVVIRRNIGLNRQQSVTLTLAATGIATQNASNYDMQVSLTGGTVTSVRLGALPEPNTQLNGFLTDVTGGGSGWTTGSTSFGFAYADPVNGSNHTTSGMVNSPSVSIANATDTIVLAALPLPGSVTPTAASGNSALPTGTYGLAIAFFSDVGEAPPTAIGTVTLTAGNLQINIPQVNLPSQSIGIRGMRLYTTSGPLVGLLQEQYISNAGTAVIPANTSKHVPFAIPAPTQAPSTLTDAGVAGQFTGGVNPYYFVMTYVTPCGIETVAGPISSGVTIAANHALNLGTITITDTGVQTTLGQINVDRVRIYAVGTAQGAAGNSPDIGLVADIPIALVTPAGTVVPGQQLNGILSTALPPTVDQSLPKTNATRTDGWRCPPGVTTVQIWATNGGTSWKQNATVSEGILSPQLLTGPGTTGTPPTVNNTGVSWATTTPTQFTLTAGETIVVAQSAGPTVVAVQQ